MKIFVGNKEYDLPVNFALEMERQNPFFNSIGEKSLPVTLPLTPNNKQIIGHYDLNNKNKIPTTLQATIIDGTNVIYSKQIVHSISSAGISTTFYLGVGCFWSKVNSLKVRDIVKEVVYKSTTSLLADMMKARDWAAAYDFVVFPAAFKLSGDAYWVMNATTIVDGVMTFNNAAARRITDGEDPIDVPAMYGMTAFLKCYRALEILFKKLGYSLKDSFLSQSPWNQLVLLNNTVDACCIGYLKYAQLYPDLTVQEFLNIFRKKFNIEFIPDEAAKTMSIIPFDSTLIADYKDISNHIDGELTFTFNETFGRITIKQSSDQDEGKTDTTTLEKFKKKYADVVIVNEVQFTAGSVNNKSLKDYAAVLRASNNRFYKFSETNNVLSSTDIGTASFNYDKEDTDVNIKAEAVELVDSVCPMILASGSSGGMGIMPFVGPAAHLNTSIKDTTEDEDSKSITMLCFAKKLTTDSQPWSYGSVNEYDYNGSKDLDYSLNLWGSTGIFQKFYAKKDAILRHSNYVASAKFLLPESVKYSLTETGRVMLNNQFYIPDSIAYTIGEKISKECKLRSIRLFEPYDLSVEQETVDVPNVTADAVYKWVYHDDADAQAATHGGDCSIAVNVRPEPDTLTPTAEQYAASLTGTKFFEASTDGTLYEYDSQGNLVNQSFIMVNIWFTAEKV